LTATLTLQRHFEFVTEKSKFALNSFKNMIDNRDVTFESKLKNFRAVSRSIICYGAQVWGYEWHEGIESEQNNLLRSVFSLPRHAPKYALYLETGLLPLYEFTLSLHLKYIRRCAALSQDRYPRILAAETLKKKTFWARSWIGLCHDNNLSTLLVDNMDTNQILSKVTEGLKRKYDQQRRESQSRNLYKQLNIDNSYVFSNTKSSFISWMFKARTELIYPNKYSFTATQTLCSLCNRREEEDVCHFVAVCPVLTEVRIRYFGRRTLEPEQLKRLLNGERWMDLSLYCRAAWEYRYALIQEFNY
jgi:hypothetical protein